MNAHRTTFYAPLRSNGHAVEVGARPETIGPGDIVKLPGSPAIYTVREIIHGVAILDYGQSGFNFPHPVEDLVVVREHPSPHSG